MRGLRGWLLDSLPGENVPFGADASDGLLCQVTFDAVLVLSGSVLTSCASLMLMELLCYS
jgi:hypothetical protein